jgi:hypothetical protein
MAGPGRSVGEHGWTRAEGRAHRPDPPPCRTWNVGQALARTAVLTGIFLGFASAGGFGALGTTISSTPLAYSAVIFSSGAPCGSGTWRSNVPLNVSTR